MHNGYRRRTDYARQGELDTATYIVTDMWLAAACNEANINAAPTTKLIATANTKVCLDRMGCSPVEGPIALRVCMPDRVRLELESLLANCCSAAKKRNQFRYYIRMIMRTTTR